GAGAGPTLLRGREPGGQTDLVARFAQGPSRGPENDRGRPVRRRHDPSLSLSMNRAVVGQASRLPSGRLAPGFVAGETPAQTAGTAAPLPTARRSGSPSAHKVRRRLSCNLTFAWPGWPSGDALLRSIRRPQSRADLLE